MLFATAFQSEELVAQERIPEYNPNSVYAIPESEIMYRRRLWRRMDLNEKMNEPFFAFGNEITKVIIDAVNDGRLFPYENDSLKTRMTKEEFLENLKLPQYGVTELTDEERAMGFTDDNDGWGDWGDDTADAGADDSRDFYFFPRQVSVLEVMEDFIFDKRRSRAYWDIQAINLIIPAKEFPETGLQRRVASFRYKDLEQLFRSMPQEAVWFNYQNQKANLNLADAFLLRLFSANIVKYWNPQNQDLVDIYKKHPREALLAAKWVENELLEFEHNLWSY
jgi:gliding motility associated protien GldN